MLKAFSVTAFQWKWLIINCLMSAIKLIICGYIFKRNIIYRSIGSPNVWIFTWKFYPSTCSSFAWNYTFPPFPAFCSTQLPSIIIIIDFGRLLSIKLWLLISWFTSEGAFVIREHNRQLMSEFRQFKRRIPMKSNGKFNPKGNDHNPLDIERQGLLPTVQETIELFQC